MDQSISTHNVSIRARDELKSRGYDYFTLRPWNLYNPKETLWWLVPSKDWPSYKYGKIAIFWDKKLEVFRVGFHLEKGISTKAGQMLPIRTAEKLCIKPDWIWHTIVDDIKSGKFTEKLSDISKTINKPLKLIIHVSAIKDKESSVRNFEGLKLTNNFEFNFNGRTLECIKDNTIGDIRVYSHIDKIEDLIKIFEAKKIEWFWIDFYVVTEISKEESNQIEKIIPVFVYKYEEIFRNFNDTKEIISFLDFFE